MSQSDLTYSEQLAHDITDDIGRALAVLMGPYTYWGSMTEGARRDIREMVERAIAQRLEEALEC